MISMKYHQMGGHLPNEEQQLLIKATILEKDQALSAWQAWKKRVDTNHIDPGSFKLIPLLFRQLTSFGIEDPLLSRYKSVYRSIWYRNQLLLDHSSLHYSYKL